MAERVVFKDPVRQREFSTDGFTTVDLIDPGVLREFAERFESIYSGERVGFHSSLESPDFAYRDQLHDLLMGTFSHFVDELFVDHKVVMAQATVKWAGGDSTVRIHQDWSIVEEPAFWSFNLWIPLVSTRDENGSLYMLPGSHRDYQRYRPNGGFPGWYHDPAGDLPLDRFVPVHVDVGQAVISNNAILHHSPPNRSVSPRIAVVLCCAPREAELIHLVRNDDDSISRYTITDPLFFRRVIAYEDPRPLTRGMPVTQLVFSPPSVGEVDPPSVSAEGLPPTGADESAEGDRSQPGRQPFWRHLLRRPRSRPERNR